MRYSAFIQGWRYSAFIQSWRCSAWIQDWRYSALPGFGHFRASTRIARAAALALLLLGGSAAAGNGLPLRIGPHAFQVELASTPQQRQRGLMGRTHLAADGGMLFVFEQPGRHCFWMRDTPLPLSIAFIDASGRIASLADMQPRSEALHCPGVDVRYALEVRQGEFQRRGIAPRAQVSGLPQ